MIHAGKELLLVVEHYVMVLNAFLTAEKILDFNKNG